MPCMASLPYVHAIKDRIAIGSLATSLARPQASAADRPRDRPPVAEGGVIAWHTVVTPADDRGLPRRVAGVPGPSGQAAPRRSAAIRVRRTSRA
jgi:hypothetical protein